ncbi:hypothetical protein FRC09_003111 [Ceratobasidium sp. 395]|nr:hypothetical protein FRC09_003111 [Ceratobasidium sp. 395]
MSDQKFTTQPAPSDPSVQDPTALQEIGSVLNVPGPQIPDKASVDALGAALASLSPEELKKRQEELNKES